MLRGCGLLDIAKPTFDGPTPIEIRIQSVSSRTRCYEGYCGYVHPGVLAYWTSESDENSTQKEKVPSFLPSFRNTPRCMVTLHSKLEPPHYSIINGSILLHILANGLTQAYKPYGKARKSTLAILLLWCAVLMQVRYAVSYSNQFLCSLGNSHTFTSIL